jgi:hypothetical protein
VTQKEKKDQKFGKTNTTSKKITTRESERDTERTLRARRTPHLELAHVPL